jgi:glutamate---cysteine ligase / carboxylate-amine ligase
VTKPRSVGVEEELLLVEPDTGRPAAVAGSAMRAARQAAAKPDPEPGRDAGPEGEEGEGGAKLEFELQLQQLETSTDPYRALDDLGRELRRCRAAAASAAQQAGAQVAALATSPVAAEPALMPKPRYLEMAETFGPTASEQLTCGCHVHVEISSPDEGVAVLDRIQPWLAPLLALSANSPFWQGTDSGYASFRYQAWGRWPSSGPAPCFGTAQAYRDTVGQMVATQTVLDAGMVYFDARLSEHYPTLEIRIADVCLHADDPVLIAGLARALVDTEARAWREGRPARCPRAELLRLASWRASRSGLDGALLSPLTDLPEEPPTVIALLLQHVSDALEEAGDQATVTSLLETVLARGNGATFQRRAYQRSGDLSSVASQAAAITTR